MLEVENIKLLKALQNHDNDELALVTNENKFYQYNEELKEWIPYETGAVDTGLTVYELNKQIISQMKELSQEQIQEKKEIIKNYVAETSNMVYMLIFKDINYYTVLLPMFKQACNTIENEVIECLEYLGAIKSIELTESGNIECWIQEPNAEYPIVGYFFNYDGGTILCQ